MRQEGTLALAGPITRAPNSPHAHKGDTLPAWRGAGPPGQRSCCQRDFILLRVCLQMAHFRRYLEGRGREAASTPIDLCTTIALLLPLAPPAACSTAVAGEGIRKERPPHPCAAISVNRKGHLSKTLNYLSSSLQLLGK